MENEPIEIFVFLRKAAKKSYFSSGPPLKIAGNGLTFFFSTIFVLK